MAAREIALNTDVGEGFGVWTVADDETLLGLVTCANIACGFHAGDPDILRRSCEVASERGVSIGAQVSYRDLAGFGRRYLAVPEESLVNDIVYQIGALEAFARTAGTRVGYVKAHGALYNTAARDTAHASAIIRAIRLYDPRLPVLCQPGTRTWELASEYGIPTVAEGFLDRAYTADGLLVPRGTEGAVITDPEEAARRAVRFATAAAVTTIDGGSVSVPAESLCVHSDTAGAVDIVRATVRALGEAGVALVPMR